jgi:hypothetical protein
MVTDVAVLSTMAGPEQAAVTIRKHVAKTSGKRAGHIIATIVPQV